VNIAQIKAELATIYEELIDTADGAHWSSLYAEFNDRHPDARFEVGAELYDEMLKDKALKVMSETDRRAGRRQLSLPGLDAEWDATVTLPDGEGSFRRKRLERATASDLVADEEIHRMNVDAAVAALDRATQRNTVLLPVMEDHGFVTAGDAIEYLAGPA
jgi:hypothetical protein